MTGLVKMTQHSSITLPFDLFLTVILVLAMITTVRGQQTCPGAIHPEEISFSSCGSDKPIVGDIPGGAQQISMTISPQTVQCFRVKTTGKKYIRVEVLQQGVDVIVQLFKQGPEKILEPIDSPNGRDGVEPVSFITDENTEYILAVRSQEPAVGPREPKYTIRLAEARPSNSNDVHLIDAERAVLRGNLSLATAQQMNQPGQEQQRIAVAGAAACHLQHAVTIYRRLGNTRLKDAALNSLGVAYQVVGRFDDTRAALEELLTDARGAGQETEQIIASINLGRLYARIGNLEQAEKAYKNATEVPGTSAPHFRATAWRELGKWYASRRNSKLAIDAYDRSAEAFNSVGDKNAAAEVLTFAGVLLFDQSSIPPARDYFEKALVVGPDQPDILAYASYHLGMTMSAMGYRASALEKLLDAARYFESERARNPTNDFVDEGEAYVWANLGLLYARLGQYQTGLPYTEKAIKLAEPKFLAAAAYAHLYRGMNLIGLQKRAEADAAFGQSLKYWKAMGNKRGEAMATVNLGGFFFDRREYQEALQHLRKAQELQQDPAVNDLHGLAYTFTNIGRIFGEFGQIDEGLAILRNALSLRKKVGDREGEAITLYTIGLLESKREQYPEAHKQLGLSRAILDEMRRDIGHRNLRATFFSTVRRVYQLDVDVLIRLGHGNGSQEIIDESLTLNDNTRARSLVEVLAAERIGEQPVVDPELLSKSQRLRDRLSTLRGRLLVLQQDPVPGVPSASRAEADRQAVAVAAEINEVIAELQVVDNKIDSGNPNLAAIINPPQLTLQQIRGLLDPETVLLEYFLGEKDSYLWVVTNEARHPVRLEKLPGGRARIEDLANELRKSLRDPQTRQSQIKLERLSLELSRILIKPARPHIGRKRLAIVADGILQYIPFAVLSGLDDKWQPLVKNREIIKLPSMAALFAIRQKTRQTARFDLALITDPTYELGNNSSKGATASLPNRYAPPLEQLAFAQEEKNSLERIFSKAQLSLKVWEGPDANRQNATSPVLKDFRIIQYTAHGKADDEHPEKSGIFLSLYGRDGRPIEDYFVGLSDIYRMQLNAELVVLAACDTALGKEIKGEGLIGITRGFMYSGVPTVMSSLWEAHQFHTVSLIRTFYESMVQDDKKAAASLREAQINLWERRKLPPYYWAAFELQGDWR
jgi:CHAT domain-containing protein/tetratricopeptide (TPR) repeat protein